MFYISDCCRICLQYDKNLLDITSADKNTTETLLSKLKVCVSEVEWSSDNLLLCQSCITRLNSSYEFKKQCILSSETWKKYMELVRETQNKLQAQVNLTLAAAGKDDSKVSQEDLDKAQEAVQNAFLQVGPNQKLLKLYVGGQGNQNVIPNILVNIIPTGSKANSLNSKEVSQGVFLNINNALQKSTTTTKAEDVNVSKILTESKSEELSVEIDPMDFECLSEESPMPVNEMNDWEELISSTQLTNTLVPKLIPISNSKEPNNSNTTETVNGKNLFNCFIPILPKPENLLGSDLNQEKYEIFNSGHFLTPKEATETDADLPFPCEMCSRNFESLSLVRFHVKQFHSGKFPYKCDFCFGEFAAKSTFDMHVLEKHGTHLDAVRRESLTLQDFPKNEDDVVNVEFENGDPNKHACDICGCAFSSANGLMRHKSRKHNQNSGKKKYFVKGMKNARCDICKRDFSTQSYLQLHLKLHQRKGPTYRGKIFRTKPVNEKNPKEGGCDVNVSQKKSPSLKIRINLKNIKKSPENPQKPTTNGTNRSTIYKAIFHDVSADKEKKLLAKIFSSNDPAATCPYCNQLVAGDLKAHLKDTHFKRIQYKCHLCNNAFTEPPDLTEHLRLHHTSALCTICMQMFATESEMRGHNAFLHSDSAFWQCGVCYVILTIRELKDHMRGHHGEAFAYVCHFCGDEVNGEEAFGAHIAAHDGAFECKGCDLRFEYEHEKRDHDVEKHGKKYFDCILCGKKYNCLHELTRHRNLHQWHPHLLQNNNRLDDSE